MFCGRMFCGRMFCGRTFCRKDVLNARTFCRSTKYLPLLPPRLHQRFAALNQSPQGWDKNTGVDCHSRGGYSKCKAPTYLPWWYHFNILPPMLSFSWPLPPPTPPWKGSYNKKSGDHWHPLGFFSKKLNETESRYYTFYQELLAVYLST
jgi:hypothetical protein